MKKILYLADCNLIHDLKWIDFFSSQTNEYQCFVIMRQSHFGQLTTEKMRQLEQRYRFKILGAVEDFSVSRFWKNYPQKSKIQGWIKAHQIDIFHIFYAEPNALWANFDYGCPLLLTSRGTDVLQTIPSFFQRGGLLSRLVVWAYKRAFARFEAITCTSQRQIQSIENHFIIKNKPQLIRTGVEVDYILENRPELLPAELKGKKYLLFPRNMRPIYNHEFAAEALAQLSPALKAEFWAVFINKDAADQPYVRKIEDLLSKTGANYLFLSSQSQETLFEMYKNAQLVIMCPHSDGTPVSAIEAMICRAPLILPPLRYDEDIFRQGEVAMLSQWNSQELAQLISDSLAGRLNLDTEAAQHQAAQQANRQLEMRKLADIYEKISN